MEPGPWQIARPSLMVQAQAPFLPPGPTASASPKTVLNDMRSSTFPCCSKSEWILLFLPEHFPMNSVTTLTKASHGRSSGGGSFVRENSTKWRPGLAPPSGTTCRLTRQLTHAQLAPLTPRRSRVAVLQLHLTSDRQRILQSETTKRTKPKMMPQVRTDIQIGEQNAEHIRGNLDHIESAI